MFRLKYKKPSSGEIRVHNKGYNVNGFCISLHIFLFIVPLFKTWRRWEDNIKMDLEEIEWKE
jgi:hypothetical protein